MHLMAIQKQKCYFLGSNVHEYIRNTMYTSAMWWWICFQTSQLFKLFKNSRHVLQSHCLGHVCPDVPAVACVSPHCWTGNLWIGFATKQTQKQPPQGRYGCSTPGAWSIFHAAPGKQHLQPCLGAWWSVAWPPLIWLVESDDGNLRWAENLHRRQRCSKKKKNGQKIQISSDHRSQKNDPLKKLSGKPTLFNSCWKPPGSCWDQRESMALRGLNLYTH